MADKSFGVKELNLLNASGTPTVTSPNNLNLNANTVAISTSCTIGNNLTVTSTTNSANLNVTGIGTLTRGFATDLSVSGISTISQPSNANPHSLWDVVNNGSSAYRFTGPGQDGAEDNPDIYLVRGQRYIFKVNASGHPFQLRVANGGAAYSDGVTNNGAQTGNVVFNVQHDAPAQLYYQCTSHGSMVGNIYIVGGPQVISGVVTATTFSGNLSGGTVSGTTGTFTNNLSVAQNIVHIGDTDTKIEFLTDTLCFETAGAERLRITSDGYRQIRNYHLGPWAFVNDTYKTTITVGDPGDHKFTTIKFILTIIDGAYRQGFWQGEFVIWSSNAVGGPGVSHVYKKIWDNVGSTNWSGGTVSYQMSGGAFQFKADNGHDDAAGNAYIHILDVIGDIDGSTVASISS